MKSNTMQDPQTEYWMFFPGAPDLIDLEPEYIEQACEISNSVTLPTRSWQCYLQSLILQGFIDWLQQRQPNLQINYEDCSVSHPYFANVVDAVFNLQIGAFKVCLIPTTRFTADEISIPRAVIDIPTYTAHFYVVIAVNEEADTIGIQGFLRYDQLASYRPYCPLNEDWSYALPSTWLNLDPDELLLNLQCLSPTAIALPKVTNPQTKDLTQFQDKFPKILPQLNSTLLWELLPWEQGAALLQHPDLLELIYSGQVSTEMTPTLAARLQTRLQEVVTLTTQTALNTAYWLDGKLDEVAQSLSIWHDTSLTHIPAMRSAVNGQQFQRAIAYLREQGLPIPTQVNSVYQDQDLAGLPLCLCATVWSNTPEANTDWSLLLMLRTQTGKRLPAGTQLRVSNIQGIVRDVRLETAEPSLYVWLEGQQGEAFVSTVITQNDALWIGSPYTFDMSSVK